MDNKDASTQSSESVAKLLNFLGKPANPLPAIVPLADGMQLTKSSKGDCYYVTSPSSCTCLGFHYRQTCRHVKSLARIKPQGQSMPEVFEQHDANLPKMPASYRRIVKAAREEAEADLELKPKGSFKPFLE
jgi:hypothetical protein